MLIIDRFPKGLAKTSQSSLRPGKHCADGTQRSSGIESNNLNSLVENSDAAMLVLRRQQLLLPAQSTCWDQSSDAQPLSTTDVYELAVVSPSPNWRWDDLGKYKSPKYCFLMLLLGGWNSPQARSYYRYLRWRPPPKPLSRVPQGQRRPSQLLPCPPYPLPTQTRPT